MQQQNNEIFIQDILKNSFELAEKLNHEYLTIEHTLLTLLDYNETKNIISKCNSETEFLKDDLSEWIDSNISTKINDHEPLKRTKTIEYVIQMLFLKTISNVVSHVDSLVVLISVLENNDTDCWAEYFLKKHGITLDKLYKIDTNNKILEEKVKSSESLTQNTENMNDETALEILNKFCTNLNEMAQNNNIDLLIGRKEEVYKLVHCMGKRKKSNSILVGHSGVGKTQIVEGLAKKIVDNDVPELISDATLWSLDIGDVVAGSRYRGEFEERLKAIMKAFEKQEKVIVFIDEIHLLLSSGTSNGNGGIDAGNLLKPFLSKGNVKFIGSTTLDEYRNIFEKDNALNRRFERLDIHEPTLDESKEILYGLKSSYEDFHDVFYTNESIENAVDLSNRFITNKHLPDKAIDILDSAGARQKLNSKPKAVIYKSNIITEISKMARIPEQNLHQSEKQKLIDLEKNIKNNIFGQDNAIDRIVRSVQVSKAGLRNINKPLGIFLFTGPTGTGKTELSKILSTELNIPLKRFDMSEYMEHHSVSRLIGAPPGYVGHDDKNGLLADAIDNNPHCIILLDEIEKAHSSIMNILLQIMDYGNITNGKGKSIDCKNVFIIMTSNVGAQEQEREKIGFDITDKQTEEFNNYNEAVKTNFSPEFRNRLDSVVVFNKLSYKNINKIVDKFIDELNLLIKDKDITLNITENAKEWFVKNGYQPDMGARPMERLIHEQIKEPLSLMILKDKLNKNDSILVDYENNEISVTKKDNMHG